MEYPKKLIASFANGEITKKEFERMFAAYQRKNGVDFSCRGFGDSSGLYVTYREQKAVLKNGILQWSYGKTKTAKNLFEFRRKIDAQILGEKR